MGDEELSYYDSFRDIAAIGDAAAMRRYYWLSKHEDSNRLQTQRAHANAIDLWQRAIEIRSRPFSPGTTITYRDPAETIDQIIVHMGFEYRLSQIIMTVGTSKITLDACLGGYYSQALALCRNLLEAYKRIAYARRSPHDAYRWYPREWLGDDLVAAIGDRYTSKTPDQNDWKRVFPDIPEPNVADVLDWGFNYAVKLHIDDLHPHTHPTLLGTMQQRGDSHRGFIVHPDFDAGLAYSVLREGSVAEALLMEELSKLVTVDQKQETLGEAWSADVEQWRDDYLAEFTGSGSPG